MTVMLNASRRLLAFTFLFFATSASAQTPGEGPPAVGVATVAETAVNETSEFNGRIEATDKVNVVARVSAFLEQQLFTEGADVKKDDLLFRLERPPYEAEVEAKTAAVAEAQATVDNANIAFERADQLRKSEAGSQSSLDNALASQRTSAARLRSAQAALRSSQVNLDYTEIRSPIDGRVGRTTVSVGNVVSASLGTLVTVVSQDPMYVTFKVPTRKLIEFQQKYGAEKGDGLRLRLRLPDGRVYDQTGKLDFLDISVASDTDSITVRGAIPNAMKAGGQRELFNDEFVRVIVEAVTPEKVLAIPRAAVLTDQQGDFVYVVGADNVAQIRRIKLGQSTAQTATIVDGLAIGDKVVAEGVQRVRPNMQITQQPLAAQDVVKG